MQGIVDLIFELYFAPLDVFGHSFSQMGLFGAQQVTVYPHSCIYLSITNYIHVSTLQGPIPHWLWSLFQRLHSASFNFLLNFFHL